jgi:hypothetical protein
MRKTQLAFPTPKGHRHLPKKKKSFPHSHKETATNCSTTKTASTTSGTDNWIRILCDRKKDVIALQSEIIELCEV